MIIFSFFYNREKEVNTSITSLLESAPENSKVILVNDGSTDNTLFELRKFATDPRVTLIDQANRGLSKSLSALIPKYIEMYNPQYIAIHGAGDVCDKYKFKKQIQYLEQNPDIVALGTGYDIVSKETGQRIKRIEGLAVATRESLYKHVPFTHGTVIYRKEAYLKAGGYNHLFYYCQDWDFYFRLLPFGKIVRYPEVLYTKYIFSDGASFNPKKKIEQLKYKSIILSRKVSDAVYEEKLRQLREEGIDSVVTGIDFNREKMQSKITLIAAGELNLAREWTLLEDKKKDLPNIILRSILSFMIFLKFPAYLLPKVYRIISNLKKLIKIGNN